MTLFFQNEKLTIDEVISGSFEENIFSEFEIQVINFVKKWYSKNDLIEFVTSGSTGPSKVIALPRDKMEYSAITTMNFVDPKKTVKNAIICINPLFIGGAMLLVRALMRHMDIYLVNPSSSPDIPRIQDSMVSLVPMQVINLLERSGDYLNYLALILIGGAPLPDRYQDKLHHLNAKIYQTYGMTETISHIALKDIKKDEGYRVIGDAELKTDENSCLMIKGTITNHQWLTTHDMVKLKTDNEFEVVGRADLVINSGGFKINPESIESKIQDLVEVPVVIVPKKDQYLGQKVILLVESDRNLDIDQTIFEHLHPYEKPKEIHCIPAFKYTKNGKIDRFATAKLI